MKKFNEWLKEKNNNETNEAWWPFGKKEKEPESELDHEETPAKPAEKQTNWTEDPKYQAKDIHSLRSVGFMSCPHCRSNVHWYDLSSNSKGETTAYGTCKRCDKNFWIDEESLREVRRKNARDRAVSISKSLGSSNPYSGTYEFDGKRYHVDPKGAAEAEERAKNRIRGDLSNI